MQLTDALISSVPEKNVECPYPSRKLYGTLFSRSVAKIVCAGKGLRSYIRGTAMQTNVRITLVF